MDIAKACRRTPVQKHEKLIHLSSTDCARELVQLRDESLYFDIETRAGQMTCFSFASNHTPTFSFLVRNYMNQLQQGSLVVLCALARALMRNTVVVHNCMYDLPFLTFYHGFPFPRQVYDTMCSHHRIFPEADKSLAHCISLYTNYPNHKVISINETHSPAQDEQLLTYNSYDVQVLKAIHFNQAQYATQLGCTESIAAVNRSIPPYAKMGLRGLVVSTGERFVKQKMLARRLVQLQRIANLALGPHAFELSSPKQAVNYFHNVMGMPAVEETASGNPSLKGDNLYVLALGTESFIIPLIIHYREVDKELTMLKFKSPGDQTMRIP